MLCGGWPSVHPGISYTVPNIPTCGLWICSERQLLHCKLLMIVLARTFKPLTTCDCFTVCLLSALARPATIQPLKNINWKNILLGGIITRGNIIFSIHPALWALHSGYIQSNNCSVWCHDGQSAHGNRVFPQMMEAGSEHHVWKTSWQS